VKHLSSEQLSAHLDGALTGRAAEEAERHLAACDTCRAALAALAAQDASLRPALTHDPGEAYFESFAGRVGERIRAAGLAGAQARERGTGLGRLLQSPRALAWAGGVAVLVVGAGLALMTTREVPPPNLREREIADRVQPASPTAKPEASAPEPAGSRLDQDKARAGAEAGQDEANGPASRSEGGATRPTAPAEPLRFMTRQKVDRLAAPARQPAPGAPSPPAAAELQVRGGRTNEIHFQAPSATSASPGAAPLEKSSAGALKDAKAATSAKRVDDGAKVETPANAYEFAKPPGAAALAPSSERPVAPVAGARSSYAPKQALGATPDARLCGEVRDASGRPVGGAQVTVADVGRTATSDARGAFCLEAPGGEHTLSVMAVGFAESRQTVTVGATPAVRVTLDAVPVMEDKRASVAGRTPLPRVVASPPAEPTDRYSALPDTVRAVVRAAQQLETTASSGRSARLHDAAAANWERALKRLEGSPLELETRLHLAEARYHAWEAGPNTRRADAAVEALTAYAVRAHAGPERDQVIRWLDRVRH